MYINGWCHPFSELAHVSECRNCCDPFIGLVSGRKVPSVSGRWTRIITSLTLSVIVSDTSRKIISTLLPQFNFSIHHKPLPLESYLSLSGNVCQHPWGFLSCSPPSFLLSVFLSVETEGRRGGEGLVVLDLYESVL